MKVNLIKKFSLEDLTSDGDTVIKHAGDFHVVTFEAGYQVALKKDKDIKIKKSELKYHLNDILDLTKNMKEMEMFGWWYNEEDDYIYIDKKTIILTELRAALYFAEEHQQLAVWDWKNNTEIRL